MKMILVMLMLLVSNVIGQTSSTKKDDSPHTSAFVTANGVKLHYLDWGGSGEVIVFS